MTTSDLIKIIDIYYGKDIENIKNTKSGYKCVEYVVDKILKELKLHNMAISKLETVDHITKDNTIITSIGIEHISKESQYTRAENLAIKYVESLATLGEKIIRYRMEHKITQEDFADKCGLCFVIINRIENNANYSHTERTIKKINKVLNEDGEYTLDLFNTKKRRISK